MQDSKMTNSRAAKWLTAVLVACAIVYLGVCHIENVAGAILWLVNLFKPILLGIILALIINVPMRFVEEFLQVKIKKKKLCRAVSIVISLVFVFGIFVGVICIVLPKLVDAVKIVTNIIVTSFDFLAGVEEHTDWSHVLFGEYLSQINIDLHSTAHQLEQWFSSFFGKVVNHAMGVIGIITSEIAKWFIGIVFSVYILAQKELLKSQVSRLIDVWIPKKYASRIMHASRVSSKVFKEFIIGQATEAVVLGTLCMLGMFVLQIPYAPIVGTLVGVTALVPIVGAFAGTIIGAIMILTVAPFKALVFVVFLLILQQIEGNLIYPRVVGAKINLPAIWVLAAVTVGGGLAGPVGMLLGVPAASAVYELLKDATEKREQSV